MNDKLRKQIAKERRAGIEAIQRLEKENAELRRLNTLCPMCGKEAQWGDFVVCLGCAKRMGVEAKERDELRAQLARCVDAGESLLSELDAVVWDDDSSFQGSDCDHLREVLNSLPATASVEAEILRCALEVYEYFGADLLEQGPEMGDLARAVRARNEV